MQLRAVSPVVWIDYRFPIPKYPLGSKSARLGRRYKSADKPSRGHAMSKLSVADIFWVMPFRRVASWGRI